MLQVTHHAEVTVLTLDRPEKRNALNTELCRRVDTAVREALAGGARALVVTGAGSSFCSGADLGEVYSGEFREALYGMLRTVTDAPVAVLASVNGPAIGAGTQLALAADLRIAAPAALFGLPTAKLGLAVDPWTIRRLALLAGNGTARALLLACDQLTAERAREVGLVERLGELETAVEWAAEVSALAPLTVAYSKRVLNRAFEADLDESLDKELRTAFEACWASDDFAEGRRARAQKRPPRFRGR